MGEMDHGSQVGSLGCLGGSPSWTDGQVPVDGGKMKLAISCGETAGRLVAPARPVGWFVLKLAWYPGMDRGLRMRWWDGLQAVDRFGRKLGSDRLIDGSARFCWSSSGSVGSGPGMGCGLGDRWLDSGTDGIESIAIEFGYDGSWFILVPGRDRWFAETDQGSFIMVG
ncbi:hypothetical protein NPIL_382981 [Nephila pilipes]|uniref:Uncharacterized protein n=1 Tax=Nephila pilipes TaxID=299642 RepID=A0A8X6UGJ6_NEPPI|nr:hypothetical protein NPIL_382981 [Nephila pilipes]